MRYVCRLLALLAAFVVVDGPMVIGQSWAWVTMVCDRTPAMGFTEAVADTMSGENPCPMCLALAEERQKEREEAPIRETRPLAKFAPVVGGAIPHRTGGARSACTWESPDRSHPLLRWDDVPLPPPRVG